MIVSVKWEGDLDGELRVVEKIDGSDKEWMFDRPGDLVAALMRNTFPDESLLSVAGGYGICLASRGITEPLFIRQIVEKTVKFVSSAQPSSLPLMKTLHRFTTIAAESSQQGVDLRRELLEEARRVEREQAETSG